MDSTEAKKLRVVEEIGVVERRVLGGLSSVKDLSSNRSLINLYVIDDLFKITVVTIVTTINNCFPLHGNMHVN